MKFYVFFVAILRLDWLVNFFFLFRFQCYVQFNQMFLSSFKELLEEHFNVLLFLQIGSFGHPKVKKLLEAFKDCLKLLELVQIWCDKLSRIIKFHEIEHWHFNPKRCGGTVGGGIHPFVGRLAAISCRSHLGS